MWRTGEKEIGDSQAFSGCLQTCGVPLRPAADCERGSRARRPADKGRYLSLLSHLPASLAGVSDVVPLPPSAPATVELPVDTAALDRLPGASDTDPFLRLAAALLAASSANSARAYRTDLRAWATWCGSLGVHPLAARRHCPRTTSCVGPRTT